jgi:hypothetical protein
MFAELQSVYLIFFHNVCNSHKHKMSCPQDVPKYACTTMLIKPTNAHNQQMHIHFVYFKFTQ